MSSDQTGRAGKPASSLRMVIGCCWPPERGQGISTLTRELAASMRKAGHEVFYLSPPSKERSWFEGHGIRHIAIGPEMSGEEGVRHVIASIREVNPDAVINNDHPYVQAALPALDCSRIVISHTMAWGTFALATFNSQHADRIIAISYDMWAKLLSRGVLATKISVVYNGISDPTTDIDIDYERSMSGPLRTLFAGNWTKVKGADLLMRSIGRESTRADWLVLDCFGVGALSSTARRETPEWFRYHGHVDRNTFLSAMRNADVLLFPSRIEGCPVSVIEAMSYGVVPIVSDGRGAMRFMVDIGVNGHVARLSHWSQDMWDVLRYLNQNRERLIAMRRRAREKFRLCFDIDRMAARIDELIRASRSERRELATSLRVIEWHRPTHGKPRLKSVASKLRYRLGILSKGRRIDTGT